jgi:hypothetical protein
MVNKAPTSQVYGGSDQSRAEFVTTTNSPFQKQLRVGLTPYARVRKQIRLTPYLTLRKKATKLGARNRLRVAFLASPGSLREVIELRSTDGE